MAVFGLPDPKWVEAVTAVIVVNVRQSEATISVRGKDRFVVMDMAQYHDLRKCEVDAALAQSRADLAAGHTVKKTKARMERLLCDDPAH